MSNKIGNATNRTIIQLLQDYRSSLLILKPKFQRNLVWNDAHKAKFIQTIFDQMPFPEVYLSDGEIDLKNQKTTIWVVDGQQRLSTIFNYIDNQIDLAKYGVPLFSSLSPDAQTSFFSYVVVIRQLGKLTEDEIKEIFKRINSVNYALNAVEISNALYEGEFISLAKQVSDNPDFKSLDVLSDLELARMKDLEFMLMVLSSVELGYYYTQAAELEEVVKRYNNEYPNCARMKTAVDKSLSLINSLALDYDSIWFKKSAMFTLLTEVIKFSFYQPSRVVDLVKLKTGLIQAEKDILEAKTGDTKVDLYAKFYKHIFQQTTSKVGRDARAAVVSLVIEKAA
jgi:hypothetical protein